jgi:hypothetical protein
LLRSAIVLRLLRSAVQRRVSTQERETEDDERDGI